MLTLAFLACAGAQGGSGKVSGYCAEYDYVDALFGEPAHLEFCMVTETECREAAARWAQYHGMQMECFPSSVMHCYGYEDASREESCFISMEACEKARAADPSDEVDPVLAELGAVPVPKTPCTRR